MLSIILISVALVVVIFAISNKKLKKTEEPTIPTVEEEPLGYETSSFAAVEETVSLPVAEEVTEEPLVLAKPAKKPKAKMSAKPKTKAPKKK
jgi:hypothetical protein